MNIDWIEIIFTGAFTALVTWAGTILTIKFNYNDMYSRCISSNRMDWINGFRKEVGTIIACVHTSKRMCRRKCNINRYIENVFKAEQARAVLRTRLNLDTSKPGNEYNVLFDEYLKNIDFNSSIQFVDTEKLIELTRKILEPEWQRVKDEAKGIRR